MGRVVVTGDAGFIGFHLVKHLLGQGHDVLGIDALTDYYDPQLKRDRLAQLTQQSRYSHITERLEKTDRIVSLVGDFGPDSIVHLAAQAGVRYSLENPTAYLESNVEGTFSILEAAKSVRPAHLLIASTSSVYGGNVKIPFAERDTTQAPVSLYAATKLAAEALAHSYSHLWKIPTTCFRFFTVYGPWGRPDMALFKFVSAINAGEPIDVYGFGQMQRDFTYIDDLVHGIDQLHRLPPVEGLSVSAHDTLSPVAPFRIVNLGGGQPVELLDFVAAVEASLGRKSERRMLPMQPGDVVSTSADATLLQDLVGSVPRTPVRDGVQAFVDWYQSYYQDRSRPQ